MTQPSPEAQAAKYWNVFAAVLQQMLEAQTPSRGLGHLDNRPDPTNGKTIHPFKVARLKRSLGLPIFPTLSPEDIDAVVRAFGLTFKEKVRLHAAVLATAVQSMLANRIGPRDARLAGWQVLPIIEQQLHNNWDDDGLGSARDPLWLKELLAQGDVDEFTAEYGAALGEIERGALALSLAQRAPAGRERRASAETARAAFAAALAILDPVSEETEEFMLDAGRFWQAEAQRGLDAVDHLLTQP